MPQRIWAAWNRLIWERSKFEVRRPKTLVSGGQQIALQIARAVLSYLLSYAVTLAGLLL